jgi:hypothetical protein
MRASTARFLHRWIGLACSVFVLLAAGSGALHVVMTWTQSPPPRPEPPPGFTPSAVAFPVSGLPTDLRIRSVQVRLLDHEAWYLVSTPDGARYFSATDGREEPALEQRLAFDIARRHLAAAQLPPEAFSYARRLDAFDREYAQIFRLLPVHRIDVADGRGTRLYVSTVTGGVARHTDDRRQLEANLFGALHKYNFIPHKPTRDALIVAFCALAFLASLAGIALFVATRPRRASPRP